MPFWQGMILAGVVIIASLVLAVVGFYFLLRILRGVLDRRRDRWEKMARALGLTVENTRPAKGVYKPLTGERDGLKLEINYYSINPQISTSGGYSADDCVEVRVFHAPPLNFSFDLARREMLYQKVGAFFNSSEDGIGHEALDKVFEIKSSNKPALVQLLEVEMLDRESSTLLTDLMLVAKKYNRVQISESFVTLGIKTDFSQPDLIESMIDKAIYLVSRVDSATQKVVT